MTDCTLKSDIPSRCSVDAYWIQMKDHYCRHEKIQRDLKSRSTAVGINRIQFDASYGKAIS